ncbi:peptidoglycan-binding protein [Streptomyces hygroscopicus]|uniref:peptidoglycan-binding domain-containing protein n=1 Tax=Streptomyces hygroscopicus TaxID=1912 RepID=UPI00099EDBF0|nr:peptidoglycan-binding protein [Streptomyces hygroscopicus]GLV77264.1 hypothetical protein Shyhy02_52640 [Streptomyces hygroscopicus subsp. hygroscopicus]
MAAERDPDRPAGRQVIEPTAVFRAPPGSGDAPDGPVRTWTEELGLFRPPVPGLPPAPLPTADEDTQELPGHPAAAGAWPGKDAPAGPPAPAGRRRPGAVLLVLAGLGAGAVLSLVLTVGRDPAPGAAGGGAPATPTAPATSGAPRAPNASAPQAPGDGDPLLGGPGDALTLGDTGPEVSELQTRLLRIPDVYAGGRVNGEYDRALAEAVSRFQVWYGIRGDANGVYGAATRRDLEARTR